jgi:hypothetical protein
MALQEVVYNLFIICGDVALSIAVWGSLLTQPIHSRNAPLI